MPTITATAFNRDPGEAQRRTEHGPVVVTRHGRPEWVLVRHADWVAHQRSTVPLTQRLAHAASSDIDFEPDRSDEPGRSVDL